MHTHKKNGENINVNTTEYGGKYNSQTSKLENDLNNTVKTLETIKNGVTGINNIFSGKENTSKEDYEAIFELGTLALDILADTSEKETTESKKATV